jgi:disulfide oxidoreductase YuzD
VQFTVGSLISKALSAPSIGRDRALTIMEQGGAVTHLVSSLENLASEGNRQVGGVNHWRHIRKSYATRHPLVLRFLDVAGDPRSARAIHAARAIAAASLLFPNTPRRHRAVANGFLTLTSITNYVTQPYGTDGTDQLSFQVQAASTVARLSSRARLVDACLWYVALQSTMSYAVAGYAKLPSQIWRTGEALPGILRTESYGDRDAYEMAKRHPALSKALAHAVLALECAFPVAFLANGRFAPLMLGSMGAFHLVNARVMGLGRFVWAFTSTYPAVLYAVQQGAGPSVAPGSRRVS